LICPETQLVRAKAGLASAQFRIDTAQLAA